MFLVGITSGGIGWELERCSHSGNPLNRFDPLGLCDPIWDLRQAVGIINTLDVIPIAPIPLVGQVAGIVIDIAAVIGTQGILVADYGMGNISSAQFYAGSGLNLLNALVGTTGNLLTDPGNIALSVVEAGILALQSKIATPSDLEPCSKKKELNACSISSP